MAARGGAGARRQGKAPRVLAQGRRLVGAGGAEGERVKESFSCIIYPMLGVVLLVLILWLRDRRNPPRP